jgi:hypothetical protein
MTTTSNTSLFRRTAIRFVLLAMVLFPLAPRPASALEICVQTLGDLVDGLQEAQMFQPDLSGTVTLRLVAQTYAYTGALDIVLVNRLNLLGGYNADCSARTVDAANTVIDGLGQMELELVHAGYGVTIEGIRFKDADVLRVSGVGTCAEYGEVVTLRRSIFDTTTSSALAAFDAGNDCGNLLFENNLVKSLYGAQLGGAPTDFQVDAYVINNTFVDSAANGLELFRTEDAEMLSFHLSNNLFWDNAGADLALHPNSGVPLVYARHNTWVVVSVPLALSSGNNSVDPQLDGNERPTEPGSPAINTGHNSPPGGLPGVDLDGGPRLVGSAVDRGAYESSVVDVTDLVVTTIADSGPGSLRQAIIDANSHANFSTIRFALASGYAILAPATPYPDIVTSMHIDGNSQPGAVANSSEWGNNAEYRVFVVQSTPIAHAFRVPSNAAADVNLHLSGVVIGGFTNAVVLQGGAGHSIKGSHFGSAVDGFFDPADNINNILIAGSTQGVQVGGYSPADRNTISGADDFSSGGGYGISLSGSGTQHIITNNLIGTSRTGYADNGNWTGIRLWTDHSAVFDNVISGNTIGVNVLGSNNIVSANRIGLKAIALCLPPCTPDYSLPNYDGVQLASSARDNYLYGNRIAFNDAHGLVMAAGTTGNRSTANLLYDNGSWNFDLHDPAGPNPIDYDGPSVVPGDCDNANCDQNYPVLASAAGSRYEGRVTGSLSSWNDTYRIEFFSGSTCGADGHGGGTRYLGDREVTVDGGTIVPPRNGTALFDLPLESTYSLYGTYISATATDSHGNTSEFSSCVAYGCDQIFAHDFDSDSAVTCPAR